MASECTRAAVWSTAGARRGLPEGRFRGRARDDQRSLGCQAAAPPPSPSIMQQATRATDALVAALRATCTVPNGFAKLDDRGLPGITGIPRIEALIDRGERRIASFYEVIEQRLGESEYMGSDRFTLADITALCAVDFARMVKHGIPDGNGNTERWHAACSARPSAKA